MGTPGYSHIQEARDGGEQDIAMLLDEQEAVVANLRRAIAAPPTPASFAEAGIDVNGEDASFARRLPLVRANLPRVRQGVAERAMEAGGEIGERLSGVAAVVASPRFTSIQKRAAMGLAAVGTLLIIWGIVSAWAASVLSTLDTGNAASDYQAVQPPPALPSPVPTFTPIPSPTPAHGGREAPQQLTIPALSADRNVTGCSAGACWNILPVLPEQWRSVGADATALFPAPGNELRQLGAYPGEPDNLILVGDWQNFGVQLQALQLNDWLLVSDRSGSQYLYTIVPCVVASQRKECQTAKTDLSQLGHTTIPTLTLVASRSEHTNYIIRAVGGKPYSPQPVGSATNSNGQ